MSENTENTSPPFNIGDLISFDQWLRSIGMSRATGWNFRRRGAIKVENVYGRLYVSRQEIARFEERCRAGEFARKWTRGTQKA